MLTTQNELINSDSINSSNYNESIKK